MIALVGALTGAARVAHAADPLPSWNDGKAKQRIVEFVGKVTREGSPDFVPPAERIAVFDNDGTLWSEQRMYPTAGKLYTEMVYQPMLELLTTLRANGFKTYIVSGGGIEFMRPWTERVYGIPPEQVIGSSIKTTYEVRDGEPVLVRQPEIDFIDDKEGKPVAIQKHIGRRPLMAFGNSDGDFQMLEWITAGNGPRLGVLIHHDDAEREWAYDRNSPIGHPRCAVS